MGRKILFVTTDQQRYDSLGCNGGTVARTPVADRVAAEGVNFRRAHDQSVVCMPSRSTMLTGQYVRTHGVWMNGVPLPADSPSVARVLNDHGYRTALFGKSHFEPFLDPRGEFYEDQMAGRGEYGPHRGFEHLELANHSAIGIWHYQLWLAEHHPEDIAGFCPNLDDSFMVNAQYGGDTGAVQVTHNPVPRGHYHTDWVADRAIAWLERLDADEDWFCWVSFPDPHHPWDPPRSELGRVPWRDLDLPAGYVADADERRRILGDKPRQWLAYYDGVDHTNYEVPPDFVPAELTPDQVREINAMVHIENELVDEACGRLLDAVEARGWADDTDVFFTTDHGELQGDLGLLFKGPYHVDPLLQVPLIWRPAPASSASSAPAPAEVTRPVGHVDLAPTFCAIAGIAVPDWMEGRPLPASDAEADEQGRERVLTEWDSEFRSTSLHLRTIFRDGWICTAYEAGSHHDGTEGELYAVHDDPHEQHNRWDDPSLRSLRDDLVADLYDHLPAAPSEHRPKVANV